MVTIKAFRGIHYSPDKISDFASVICPPYDVISAEYKEELLKRSPYNFVRIVLDGNGARNLIDEWLSSGILAKDAEESIYIYRQDYNYHSRSYIRLGFIALLKLEELGKGVVPHEKTFDIHMEGRVKLMEHTMANTGMPFLLYDDRDKQVDKILADNADSPLFSFSDDDGITHSVYKLSDKSTIARLSSLLEGYQAIIADGHHRYKAALKFMEKRNDNQSRYLMVALVNSFNDGLIILPTHRLVKNSALLPDSSVIMKRIARYFDVEEVADAEKAVSVLENTPVLISRENNIKNHVFGMHDSINNRSYILKLRDPQILDKYFEGKDIIYKKLDCNILHTIILAECMGLSDEMQEDESNVEYVKGTDVMLKKLSEGNSYGFFVNPPLMREVFLTSRSGEVMPQKSTYFYPKLFSGLVLRKMEGE